MPFNDLGKIEVWVTKKGVLNEKSATKLLASAKDIKLQKVEVLKPKKKAKTKKKVGTQ